MGKNLIITESEKKHILSLYETAPPPSESVFVANKNPFKYPEYESARRVYSVNLKDGDLFYVMKGSYIYDMYITFTYNFIKSLYGKTAKLDDNIYTFTKSSLYESVNFNGRIGYIDIKINDEKPSTASIDIKSDNTDKFTLTFSFKRDGLYSEINLTIPSINELFTKKYKEEIDILKNKSEIIPDEYFEIRKIQRQQTDF